MIRPTLPDTPNYTTLRGTIRHARQMRGEIVRTRKNLRVRSRSLGVQTGLYRSLYPIAATFLFHLRKHMVSV